MTVSNKVLLIGNNVVCPEEDYIYQKITYKKKKTLEYKLFGSGTSKEFLFQRLWKRNSIEISL
jgi:hypothetical protein